MNEFLLLQIGFWIGYFFVLLVLSVIYMIIENYRRDRLWNFMVEFQIVQAYENWNKRNDPWIVFKKKFRSIFKRVR